MSKTKKQPIQPVTIDIALDDDSLLPYIEFFYQQEGKVPVNTIHKSKHLPNGSRTWGTIIADRREHGFTSLLTLMKERGIIEVETKPIPKLSEIYTICASNLRMKAFQNLDAENLAKELAQKTDITFEKNNPAYKTILDQLNAAFKEQVFVNDLSNSRTALPKIENYPSSLENFLLATKLVEAVPSGKGYTVSPQARIS